MTSSQSQRSTVSRQSSDSHSPLSASGSSSNSRPSSPSDEGEMVELKTKTTIKVRRGLDEDGNKTLNEYSIIAKLGKGSYGKVKLCLNNHDNKCYAVKIMNKTMLKKTRNQAGESAFNDVQREVAILKKMHHKNIVQLFEVIDDPENDQLFLVMEYVNGGPVISIDPVTGSAEKLSESKARQYMRDIIEALAYCHGNNIVHRDIKPENLLVDKSGATEVVKLTDFGVSHMFDGTDDSILSSAGTPAFIPPEACREGRFSGRAADIWAVGVTLYTMCFGELPFYADNLNEIYSQIQFKDPSIPPGTNPLLADVVKKLLHKDATKRLTLDELKEHPWITNTGASPMDAHIPELKQPTQEEIHNAIAVGNSQKVVANLAFMVNLKKKMARKVSGLRARAASLSSPTPITPSPLVPPSVCAVNSPLVADYPSDDKSSTTTAAVRSASGDQH